MLVPSFSRLLPLRCLAEPFDDDDWLFELEGRCYWTAFSILVGAEVNANLAQAHVGDAAVLASAPTGRYP